MVKEIIRQKIINSSYTDSRKKRLLFILDTYKYNPEKDKLEVI